MLNETETTTCPVESELERSALSQVELLCRSAGWAAFGLRERTNMTMFVNDPKTA